MLLLEFVFGIFGEINYLVGGVGGYRWGLLQFSLKFRFMGEDLCVKSLYYVSCD